MINFLIIFIPVGVIIGLVVHFKIKQFINATLIGSVLSSIVFQFINYLHLGYFDPFSIIAFFMGVVWYGLLIGVIGLPFLYKRKMVDRKKD